MSIMLIFFFLDLIIKLLENIDIKENDIRLVKNKEPLYKLMHSLGLVKLEKLKVYI